MNINTNLTKLNYIEILIFICIMFLILVLFSIFGINLNPSYPPPKLIQEVTVESFLNDNGLNDQDLLQEVKDLRLFPIDSFCESHLGKAGELDEGCERLTKDICLETNCCVYTNFNKCVAGSKAGPTFVKHQQGLDHYYYQNKKFIKK